MNWWDRIRRTADGGLDRVDQSIDRAAQRPGLLRQLVHIIRVAAVGIRRTNITRMAAALSYRTIFGLVPVLIVCLVVLKAFAKPEDVAVRLRQLLNFTGLSQIAVEDPGAVSPGVVPPGTVPPGDGTTAIAASAESVQRLDAWIEATVTRLKTVPANAVGIFAMVALLYAAISMVVEIEKSFNSVCQAPSGRRWTRRVPLYWTLLTLGAVLLVGSFLLTEQVTAQLESMIRAGGLSAAIGSVAQVGAYLSSLIISTAMFLIMYTAVPNTRVKFAPALLGAVLAAVFWELGKRGFTAYVGHATKNLSQMYGAVAIIPLLMLWIYVTWMIVLFGLQVAHSVQTYRAAASQGLTRTVLASLGLIDGPGPNDGARVVDPAVALVLACGVARRFTKGAPAETGELAEEVGVDERVVATMLDRLVMAGVVHRVVHEGEAAFALARPPEAVSAVEVLRVGDEIAGASSSGGASGGGRRHERPEVLEAVVRARNAGMAGRTLADLIGAAAPSASALPAYSPP